MGGIMNKIYLIMETMPEGDDSILDKYGYFTSKDRAEKLAYILNKQYGGFGITETSDCTYYVKGINHGGEL
jgi:hypothetical protein